MKMVKERMKRLERESAKRAQVVYIDANIVGSLRVISGTETSKTVEELIKERLKDFLNIDNIRVRIRKRYRLFK